MIIAVKYMIKDRANDMDRCARANRSSYSKKFYRRVAGGHDKVLDFGFYNLDKSRPQIPRMIQSAMRSAFVLLLTCSLK